jgi:hypothetical protein
MGFSGSWIGVRGLSPEQVNTALQLRPSGSREDVPESDHSGAQLPNGFYLVVFLRKELSREFLSRISAAFPLIYGFAEEHVMYSTAAWWQEGREVWSVIHDAQQGIMHLDVRGTPPLPYPAIRESLFAEQAQAGGRDAGVDYIFDIPIDLAYEITGFRYDQDVQETGKNGFEVLEPYGEKPGILKRLFRRN